MFIEDIHRPGKVLSCIWIRKSRVCVVFKFHTYMYNEDTREKVKDDGRTAECVCV